jgi:hemimethylated DNA binding protein
VYHKKYHYRGVINGWDVRPLRDVKSWEGVVNLPSGANQPFYTVSETNEIELKKFNFLNQFWAEKVIPDESDVERNNFPGAFRSSYYVAGDAHDRDHDHVI